MYRRTLLAAFLLLSLVCAQASDEEQPPPPLPTAPPRSGAGHYEHGSSGWYMPDNSGKYRHDSRPYDGGYGDSGQPYANDLRGIFRQAEQQLAASVQEAQENFSLGPRDHLRFMIDFNYNGTGWQIIQFEWVRDGDGSNEEQRQFSYVNENKLWDAESIAQYQPHSYEYQQPQTAPAEQPQVNYANSQINAEQDPAKVQSTINEVLEYIQQQILPKLT